MTPTRSLSLALLLGALLAPVDRAAAQGKGPATPPPPVAAEEDEALGFQDPPPGASAEDRAIWEAGRMVRTNIRVVRVEAALLQNGARPAELLKRLEQAAAARPAEEAKAILDLRARLDAGWRENYGVLARPWPVSLVRGCAGQVLLFESALHASGGKPSQAASLARQDLVQCTQRANIAIEAMKASTRAFRPVLEEAQKRLAELEGKAAPPAGKSAQAGAPKADAGAEPRRD